MYLEQVSVQQKLLQREKTLYNTLLGHWENTSQLAATGLSVNFSTDTIGDIENQFDLGYDYDVGDDNLATQTSEKKVLIIIVS